MEPFKNFKNFIFTQATAVTTQSASEKDGLEKVDASKTSASSNTKSNIENLEPSLTNGTDNGNRSSSVGERKKNKFNLFHGGSIKLKKHESKIKTLLRSQSSQDTTDTSQVDIDPNSISSREFTNTNNTADNNTNSKHNTKFNMISASTNGANNKNTSSSSQKKTNRKSYNILSKKASVDSTGSTGAFLFATLETNLNQLIEHFKASVTSLDSPLFEQDNPLATDKQDQDKFYMVSPVFLDTSDTSSNTYYKLCKYAKEILGRCVTHYNQLESNASHFDVSEQIKANGYRTLMAAFDSCCKRMLLVVSQLNETKSSFLFHLKLNSSMPGAINIKDFQTWVRLMEKIEIVLLVACDIQDKQLSQQKGPEDSPSLFYDMAANAKPADSSIETNLLCLGSVYQESFFGRTCGFQFCESLRTPLTGCAVALASYNDGYELYSNGNSGVGSPVATSNSSSPGEPADPPPAPATGTFIQGQATLFKSLVSGTKYMMDPELRAKKISKVMKDANVQFCKAFWQLTETDLVQMGSNIITPNVAVNTLHRVNFSGPLQIPRRVNPSLLAPAAIDYVTVHPPETSTPKDSIQIRVLSHELREGMQFLDEMKAFESGQLLKDILSLNLSRPSSKSANLVLHIHGGGFIAHSSKSHEIYLKPWCKELKVPLVSIDYSLAPEHMFPRASEECFYVYAWCLINKELLGWTGERIICVGDSAGGVLVTNVVQRAIAAGIRIPDALIPIYTPFLSTYSISPSRLMSVMDPLLNLGVLWRCLAAYSGIDFKKETEKFKSILNLDTSKVSTGVDSRQTLMRTSPTMASIIKTTPFKAFLSRSSTKSPTPPSTPTSPSIPTSISTNIWGLSSITTTNSFNIRYAKRESFDVGTDKNGLLTASSSGVEELVNIETTSQSTSVDDLKQSETIPCSEEISKKSTTATDDIALSSKQKQRLLQLHKMLGDSVFLIERLRNHPLGRNQYMSPLLSEDSILAEFPKTYLIGCTDAFLDDNIEMSRRLRQLNVPHQLSIANNGIPHAYLGMKNLSYEIEFAHSQVVSIISSALNGRFSDISAKLSSPEFLNEVYDPSK